MHWVALSVKKRGKQKYSVKSGKISAQALDVMSGNQRQTANDVCGYSHILLIVLLFIIYVSTDATTATTTTLITAQETTINETSRECNSGIIIKDNNENYMEPKQGNCEKCTTCDNFNKQETAESIEIEMSENRGSKQVLSRRRRYLSFPSGSSFQVGKWHHHLFVEPKKFLYLFHFPVYDQTLPIVTLIDIFTVGVTVAIAWPLPDEPLYKIHEQLLDKYKNAEKDRIDEIKQELMENRIDKVNVTQKPTKYGNQTLMSNKIDPTQINKIFLSPLKWDSNDWSTVIKK